MSTPSEMTTEELCIIQYLWKHANQPDVDDARRYAEATEIGQNARPEPHEAWAIAHLARLIDMKMVEQHVVGDAIPRYALSPRMIALLEAQPHQN